MTTLLVILAVWVLLSVPLAFLVARLLHKSPERDERHPGAEHDDDQRLRGLFALGRKR
ncbi:hypothetical protein [Nocardia brasiliensis]|uniref:Transmembrane protein n=1 Tax=Nocardia brasiliensis (strain ATCC 700358 / HUJEG-1) TaxID=1133849 RepID=K0EX10_NOCB7|nr:hypothetical protein [Nocardia brasiliensis]AFU04388.1 hypothetical protein O3I_032195 [Nocardia brasiliensis ATCC 700358]